MEGSRGRGHPTCSTALQPVCIQFLSMDGVVLDVLTQCRAGGGPDSRDFSLPPQEYPASQIHVSHVLTEPPANWWKELEEALASRPTSEVPVTLAWWEQGLGAVCTDGHSKPTMNPKGLSVSTLVIP
jgi:hypothetical protein